MKLTLDGAAYHAYTAARELDAARETLVFVHGAAMEHSVWNLQSRYFAWHGLNVLAVNLPGHGYSEGEPLTSIEAMAAWLRQFVAAVPNGGRAVHFIGHSMGALVALQAAADYQAETPLASLSLLGFAYPMAVAPPLLNAAKDAPDKAYAMMTQWSHASPIGGEPNPGFWSPGVQIRMLQNSRAGAVYADLNACHTYQNGEQALAAVDCPVLFVCGRADKMAPSKAVLRLMDNLKSDRKPVEIAMISGAGHSMMSEQPDAVLNALKRFIAAHSAA